MTNNLTSKQAALLCSVIIFSSKLLLLPSLFYEANKFGAILSLVILLLFELALLFLLLKVKEKYKNISFYELFSKRIGVVLTKIIYFILFAFFLFKVVYILQESYVFLRQSLYTDAPIIVYLICILPIISALAYKGLKALGRTLEIFYLAILAFIVFCLFSWIINVTNFTFTILSNNGINGLINGIFNYSFWFGDFIFLFFLIDKFKLEKNGKKHIYSYSIASMVILLLLFFSYFFMYQSTSASHNSALLDLIQFSTNFGTLGKFDIVPIMAIMFIIYFQMSLFLFCAKESISKVIPFGHKAQPFIVLNLLLILSSFLFYNNSNNLIIFYGSHIISLSIFVNYLIPILFFIFLINYKVPKKKEKPN